VLTSPVLADRRLLHYLQALCDRLVGSDVQLITRCGHLPPQGEHVGERNEGDGSYPPNVLPELTRMRPAAQGSGSQVPPDIPFCAQPTVIMILVDELAVAIHRLTTVAATQSRVVIGPISKIIDLLIP
jgi:hypothetical protein